MALRFFLKRVYGLKYTEHKIHHFKAHDSSTCTPTTSFWSPQISSLQSKAPPSLSSFYPPPPPVTGNHQSVFCL